MAGSITVCCLPELENNMIEKIEACNIIKRYNSGFALECSLSLQKGVLYTIVGPNGSGKSTLLKIMGLLDRPDSGSVTYLNKDSSVLNPQNDIHLRRKVVLVPTRAALFNETVFDNVAYGLRLRKAGRKAIEGKVMKSLNEVGLTRHKDAHAYELSSGEAQRLALARALVLDPDALLLDEPTASLDPDSTRLIEDIIMKKVRNSGKITVMVTHNLNQAKALADSVIFMYKGKIMELADPDVFFSKPATESAQQFVFGEIY
ncbi:MAG: ATP-binding cassette domain-containing protein [Nitrospiraceae bacterium]|nr:MAG: ATP-binding cassette domain-containing protein [Nitrospiraceae bacterium]